VQPELADIWPLLQDLESFTQFQIERAEQNIEEGNWQLAWDWVRFMRNARIGEIIARAGIGTELQTKLDAVTKRCNPYSGAKRPELNQNEVLARMDSFAEQLQELQATLKQSTKRHRKRS